MISPSNVEAVSYTHLDVYKRQHLNESFTQTNHWIGIFNTNRYLKELSIEKVMYENDTGMRSYIDVVKSNDNA